MTSSTSSSSSQAVGRVYPNDAGVDVWLPEGPDVAKSWDAGDPCFWTMIIAVLAVFLFGALRSDARPASAPDWFFMQKVEWQSEARTVIAGDSRVYRGFDPYVVASSLPGPVLNLGFSGVKYSDEYLAYVRSVLDDSAGDRFVLLGVTPFAFTSRSNTGFETALEQNDERRMPFWLLRSLDVGYALSPIDPTPFVPWWGREPDRRADSSSYVQTWHPNGWVESDRVVDRPHETWRAKLPVSPVLEFPTEEDQIRALLASIQSWSDEGIVVAAFAPYTPDETAALEETLLGVDIEAIARQVVAHGGYWLDVDGLADLRLYDGSHLDGPSATAYSKALADKLRELMEADTAVQR